MSWVSELIYLIFFGDSVVNYFNVKLTCIRFWLAWRAACDHCIRTHTMVSKQMICPQNLMSFAHTRYGSSFQFDHQIIFNRYEEVMAFAKVRIVIVIGRINLFYFIVLSLLIWCALNYTQFFVVFLDNARVQ